MEDHIRFDHSRGALILLDQRVLPEREEHVVCRTTDDVVYALKEMVVRGAPAIGVAAAWGCVLAACEVMQTAQVADDQGRMLDGLLARLERARPTAVNLAWAVNRMRHVRAVRRGTGLNELLPLWKNEAACIQAEDVAINRRIGENGACLLEDGDTVLTHCNAGALATAGHGTALGVIYSAKQQGKTISVIADETRPFLQGARLTAYELQKEGVPVTIACDNACALLMRKGMVQKVIVGADRIAANGDAANKIGTYGVALLAKAHAIPFYVAAPLSTIDAATPDGGSIPIEVRPEREVTHMGERRVSPDGVPVFNFAFDVTPANLITGIITEAGVLRPPYERNIAGALAQTRGTAGQ